VTSSFVLNCSPFTFSVETQFPYIKTAAKHIYGNRLIETHEFDGYIDYHVSIANSKGLRRLLKPQARFLCEGQEPFKPLDKNQGYALLEWGLNWVIATHEFSYVIVHSAVLAKGDKAILLPAPSGSGKSTLTAYLSNHGWRLLSDEMALISPADSRITPFVRPICIKNNAIDLVKTWFPDVYVSPIAPKTHKGDVAHMCPSSHSVDEENRSAEVVGIVFPKYDPSCFLDVYQLDKAGCFQGLTKNAFNHNLLGAVGINTMLNLVEKSACFEIHYNNMSEVSHFLDELVLGNNCV